MKLAYRVQIPVNTVSTCTPGKRQESTYFYVNSFKSYDDNDLIYFQTIFQSNDFK